MHRLAGDCQFANNRGKRGLRGLLPSQAAFVGLDDVEEEHCDGHGADAAGDGAYPAGDLADGVEGNIADASSFAIGTGDAIDTNIDDDCAGFDHFGDDQPGNARRGDDDVGIFGDSGQAATLVVGPFIATDDGCFFAHEEDGDGFAHDIACADDDDALTTKEARFGFERSSLFNDPLDHFDGGEGGAGREAGAAVDDVADVSGIDTLNIFFRVDEALDSVGIDTGGHGQVHHHGTDFGLGVHEQDAAGDFIEVGGGGENVELVFDAERITGFRLIFGVDTRGVVAAIDENGIEADRHSLGAERGDARIDLFAEGLCESEAIDDACGHGGEYSGCSPGGKGKGVHRRVAEDAKEEWIWGKEQSDCLGKACASERRRGKPQEEV